MSQLLQGVQLLPSLGVVRAEQCEDAAVASGTAHDIAIHLLSFACSSLEGAVALQLCFQCSCSCDLLQPCKLASVWHVRTLWLLPAAHLSHTAGTVCCCCWGCCHCAGGCLCGVRPPVSVAWL